MNLPKTFTDKMKTLLGSEYEAYLACMEQESYKGLRVNTLKITPEEFVKISPFPLQPIPWTKNGFYYEKQYQPAKHPYYFAGLYYLQEPSAMTPAAMLPVEPGDKVLDLCAAPGGKTTELGARLKGEGLLVTNDISHTRAKALLKNVELFGIPNVVVLSEPPAKLSKRFSGYFDKILIDAPCSGEGMFRKDPKIMANWEQTGVGFYADLQQTIVKEAVTMLKPGGLMLYSTCTFSIEENEGTIEYLLENYPELSLVPLPMPEGFDTGHPEWTKSGREDMKHCRRLWPHHIKGEGHFVALLQKDKDAVSFGTIPYPYQPAKPNIELNEFMKEVKLPIDWNRIEIIKDYVYYLPKDLVDIKGLRILRSGLLLGFLKKKRFEPSQAFAMALKSSEFTNAISITDPELAVKYLKCETIPVEGKDGYALICEQNYPLGWGKNSRGTLKNKYFSGWRWM